MNAIEKKQLKNKLDKIMSFLDFSLKDNAYECACNNIRKDELIRILESYNYKEKEPDWYYKNNNAINVNHLVRIIELFEFTKNN